jgi:signal transduction histidine kinase
MLRRLAFGRFLSADQAHRLRACPRGTGPLFCYIMAAYDMFLFKVDPINVALLVTGFLSFFLGVLITVSGRGKKINIVYGLNIVAIIGWIAAMFFYRSSSPEFDVFWCTVLYVVPTLIASSFLYFTYIFPSQKEKRIRGRVLAIFGVNLALIVMVVWPGLIIEEVNIRPGQEKEIIFSAYYWLYFFYTLIFFFFGFFRLFRKYLTSKGIERLQVIYLAVGYSIAANLAFVTNLVMPWAGYFHLNWMGQVFSCIMVAFTTYAILRYRLMDIRVVFRKMMVFFFSSAFVYGAFYFIVWINNAMFGSVHAESSYLIGLAWAPIFVLLFGWANARVKGIANRYLFFDLYSIHETLAKLTAELGNSIDLEGILDSIVGSTKKVMRLDRAGIALISRSGGPSMLGMSKLIGFDEKALIGLLYGSSLADRLENAQKPLIIDETIAVAGNPEGRDIGRLAGEMKKMGISLCIPMVISGKLMGIIILGSKISGDAYTTDDLRILDTLSRQAAIAVDNARLYKEVHDFSKTLECKVREQTQEIKGQKDELERMLAVEKKAHELAKRANEDLRKLDESKSDFMTITQHHLRTPLSVNSGIIDLIMSGAYGKPPKKMNEVILKLRDSNQKSIEVVNELLDISSYQLGKEVINLEDAIDFHELMEETLRDLRNEAQGKGIYLKYEMKGTAPKIPADRTKMKLVLTNVIDNCIKYTEKGGVTVTMKAAGGKLRIDVADTGIGLSEDVKKDLFKRAFSRGQNAQKVFVLGKGVGLFLSGKIVKGHHGRIWAESRGEGKGSVFHIELPTKERRPRRTERNKKLISL